MNPFAGQIAYRMFRAWGRPEVLPLNYTFSLTARCNYRCATCRVQRSRVREMSADEYRKLFASLGGSPCWATFSGGEPFLREDLGDIVDSFCRTCRPRLVNIPTNGGFPVRIAEVARSLAKLHPGIGFIVNVSIDAVGERQDEIRGFPGAWENAVATIAEIKREQPHNLTVGIGTVVSKLNLGSFSGDRLALARLGAGSMVAEPAEIRAELMNQGLDIAPSAEEYLPIARLLTREMDSPRKRGWPGLARAFRRGYYLYAYRVLNGEGGLPCYAGFASVQIMPDGEVWACCIRGDRMGRLSDFGYDFGRLWRSGKSRAARKIIKSRKCACPLANAAYTNMIFNFREGARVLANMLR